VSPSPSVAVIDVGSNSIKVLVARRGPDRGLAAQFSRTIDARISAGISRTEPRLSEDGITRGLAAVAELLADAARFQPAQTLLVATSAVRDATNGDDFRRRIKQATEHELRVLSGSEEANLIGVGLLCDPALQTRRDFQVFDLGGGSLECLTFRDRRIVQAVSLPLGCVRLTERFVSHAADSLAPAEADSISAHCHSQLREAQFRFPPGLPEEPIGTGGAVGTARAILAARAGLSFEHSESVVPGASLRTLLRELGAQSVAERRKVPGLPAARADVFPAALATLVAIADAGGFSGFRHSLYNLQLRAGRGGLGLAGVLRLRRVEPKNQRSLLA
jgi:exopolyphosphatase/guanosine-5'-triphosphate,3'-diphosphate pyrophosphatase